MFQCAATTGGRWAFNGMTMHEVGWLGFNVRSTLYLEQHRAICLQGVYGQSTSSQFAFVITWLDEI